MNPDNPFYKGRDQSGRKVHLPYPPSRIISVVPSQTEMLCTLGLEDRLAGITRYCIKPPHLKKKIAVVGGTKKLDIDKIMSLNPDLILANKEENDPVQINTLAREIPVWVSDVRDIPTAMEMISEVGTLCGVTQKSAELIHQIQESKNEFQSKYVNLRRRACYLIWKKPYMTVGADTFIHAMMKEAGFENVFSDRLRYPATDLKEIKDMNPDVILLSSEPYPFKTKDLADFNGFKTILADGMSFSWYGSRIPESFAYFRTLNSIQE